MGRRPLQRSENNAPYIHAHLLFDHLLQGFGKAAQPGMAKGIDPLAGKDVIAAGIADSFRSHHISVPVLAVNSGNFLNELLPVKRHFREINEVGRVTFFPFGQGGCSRKPAGVSAHGFKDYNTVAGNEPFQVQAGFANCRRQELGRTAVAGRVVGMGKIVVNRFGDPDDPEFVAHFVGKAVYLIRRIHGIIAADVEKITDLVFFKCFQ